MVNQEELKEKQRKVYLRIIEDYKHKIKAFEAKWDNLVKCKPEVLIQPPSNEEKEYISNIYWLGEFQKELKK